MVTDAGPPVSPQGGKPDEEEEDDALSGRDTKEAKNALSVEIPVEPAEKTPTQDRTIRSSPTTTLPSPQLRAMWRARNHPHQCQRQLAMWRAKDRHRRNHLKGAEKV